MRFFQSTLLLIITTLLNTVAYAQFHPPGRPGDDVQFGVLFTNGDCSQRAPCYLAPDGYGGVTVQDQNGHHARGLFDKIVSQEREAIGDLIHGRRGVVEIRWRTNDGALVWSEGRQHGDRVRFDGGRCAGRPCYLTFLHENKVELINAQGNLYRARLTKVDVPRWNLRGTIENANGQINVIRWNDGSVWRR